MRLKVISKYDKLLETISRKRQIDYEIHNDLWRAPRSRENIYRIVLRNIRPFTFTEESMKARMIDDAQ